MSVSKVKLQSKQCYNNSPHGGMIIVRKSEQSNSAHPLGPRGFFALATAALIRAHSQRFCRGKGNSHFCVQILSFLLRTTQQTLSPLSLLCRRRSAKLFSPVSQLLFSSLLPPNFAFTETVGFSHTCLLDCRLLPPSFVTELEEREHALNSSSLSSFSHENNRRLI